MDISNAVMAPIVVGVVLALLGGVAAWARSTNSAVRQVVRLAQSVSDLATDLRDLAGEVRDLAAASTENMLTRGELRAHVLLADERWRLLGGYVPHPRYGTADDRVPAGDRAP